MAAATAKSIAWPARPKQNQIIVRFVSFVGYNKQNALFSTTRQFWRHVVGPTLGPATTSLNSSLLDLPLKSSVLCAIKCAWERKRRHVCGFAWDNICSQLFVITVLVAPVLVF